MSSSWSRPSNIGNGRRPIHHGDSNNEEGEISSTWGRIPPHPNGGDSQSVSSRSDPCIDRTNFNSYNVSTGIPIGVPVPTGSRNIPFRNDRDPRFKVSLALSSSSGRFNPSSAANNSAIIHHSYVNPGRRVGSDSYSPKHSGGTHAHTPSISRNFSVSDVGSRNEIHHPIDGRDQGSTYIMDGIGVPMPAPKSSSGPGQIGGGNKFWRSTNALNMGLSGGSSNAWAESGTRDKKPASWSKPSFSLARPASFHEGIKSLDVSSDARPPTSFLNKFDRRAPPGGWDRDRKIQSSATMTNDGLSSNNRDYYGPSTRDRPIFHDVGIRDEKQIDAQPVPQPFYRSNSRQTDEDLSLPKISPEQVGTEIDQGYDTLPNSDQLPLEQDLPACREFQEVKDNGPILTITVNMHDVKHGAPESLNPPQSPDKKTANISRIPVSSLAHEEKINKAELSVRRLSEIMSQDELNSQMMDGTLCLPSSQQIMLGVSHIDLRIKESERELAQLRIECEELLMREEEERVQQIKKELELKSKRELELTQKYEEIRNGEQIKREIARQRYRNELNMLNSAVQALASRRNSQASEVQEQFKVTFSREFDQMNALVLVHIQAAHMMQWNELAPHILSFIEQMRAHLDAVTSIINESASNLKSLGSDDKECEDYIMAVDGSYDENRFAITSKLTELSSILKDEPKLIADIVTTVLLESRKRARESHLDALSLIPTSDDTVPTTGVNHQEWSNEHWSRLARSVTGTDNALYIEPSEAPLFQETHTQYMENRELVRKHIRSKKRKLHNRWKELSLEYINLQRSWAKEQPEITGIAPEIIISDPDAPPDLGVRGNNPYRRPRRVANLGTGSNNMGGDVVRSEYEQEQIIAKLTAQEALEKKIIHGGCPLPRQRCKVEKSLLISYHDSLSSRRVFDPIKESEDLRCLNPWSDIEKCIFLDKFFQHPKDFRKIASYLQNKSVRECIAFYYDSKQSVPYKAALKEHLIRRKRRGEQTNWDATMQAAVSVGATISTGNSEEKPFIFSVPIDDNTYSRRYFHPLRRDKIKSLAAECPPSPSIHACHDKMIAIPVGKLFSVDISPVSFPSFNLEVEQEINQKGESWDSESQIVQSTIGKDKSLLPEASNRKTQKWTKEEKRKFLGAFEQHGKNWSHLAKAVGTKSASQIKNYYYDNKNLISRNVVPTNSGIDLDIQSHQENGKIKAAENLNNAGWIPSGHDRLNVGGRSLDTFNYLHMDNLAQQQQSEMWVHSSLHHPIALAMERHRQNQISGYHHVYDFPVYSQSYGLNYLDQNLLLSQVHDHLWEQAVQRAYIQDNSQVDIGSMAYGLQQHEANFTLPDTANYMLLRQAPPIYHHPYVAELSPRANNNNFQTSDSLDRFDKFHMNN